MKSLLYLFILLWIVHASAGCLPGIMGPVAYIDNKTIVVAGR